MLNKILDRFFHNRQICVLAYMVAAFCIIIYLSFFSIKLAYFALHISTEAWQHFSGLVSGGEHIDALSIFMNIANRQSVANEIFADAAEVFPRILFCLPVLSAMLISRNGVVPCSLFGKAINIHGIIWMFVSFALFISLGLAVRFTMQSVVGSFLSSATDQTLGDVFRVDRIEALKLLLARRRILMVGSVLHLVVMLATAVMFLAIPLLRIWWAPRYVKVVAKRR